MGGLNTHAHLRGLGWLGDGHALGRSPATNNALKKPLLISHKKDTNGLGARSQRERQADQWWLNAFDAALKDVGTGRETALGLVKGGGQRAGLYARFVRGEVLGGTIGVSPPRGGVEGRMGKKERKRKRGDGDTVGAGKAGVGGNVIRTLDVVRQSGEGETAARSEGSKTKRKSARRDRPGGDSETKELRGVPQEEVGSDKAPQRRKKRKNGMARGVEDGDVEAKTRRKEKRRLRRDLQGKEGEEVSVTMRGTESDLSEVREPASLGNGASSTVKQRKKRKRKGSGVVDGEIGVS